MTVIPPTPPLPHRLLLVTFTFISGSAKTKELEPFFNMATDWYRYAPNCWLLWTSGTPETWFQYIKPHVNNADYLLIVEVYDHSYRGWLPQGAVDWMMKHQATPAGQTRNA